jgi:hypothetical protein
LAFNILGEYWAHRWQSLEATAKRLFKEFETNWPNWAEGDRDPINREWLERIGGVPLSTPPK